MLQKRLACVEADGNTIARESTVNHVVSVTIVDHVHVIAIVPIAGPGFRPRIDHAEPKTSVLETLLTANKHHREPAEKERVIFAVVRVETDIRYAVAVVTAALLPGAVLRLPVARAIALERSLFLMRLSRGPLLC